MGDYFVGPWWFWVFCAIGWVLAFALPPYRRWSARRERRSAGIFVFSGDAGQIRIENCRFAGYEEWRQSVMNNTKRGT